MTPSLLRYPKKIIIEINRFHSPRVSEISDIVLLPPPPDRDPIRPHGDVTHRRPYASVDPKKIVGIIEHSEPDDVMGFDAVGLAQAHRRVRGRVLVNEMRAAACCASSCRCSRGRQRRNAVLAGLGESPGIPPFEMYRGVREACVDLGKKA
jgi:acetyl-CoA hydrolase